MEEFCAELADIVFKITCFYPETSMFLEAYLTQKAPRITVTLREADLKRAQEEADRLDAAEGRKPHGRSGPALESLALHRLLAERLPDYDVLLMHGSALSMDGVGYLFTAPSGTGKSTHAALWRQVFGERVQMLNDDKPLLRIREDGVTVFGSPWDGKHRLSQNASAPLRAIARIERAPENRVEPMRRTEAFPVLLTQAYSSQDPAVMAKILRLERRLLELVGFYNLRCNQEPAAARTAFEGMTQSIPR